jgi:formylglycine-generating enzyme required for sulfatase activity
VSSLAELPELVGFFSYSREDDDDSKGALTALRDRIQRELRGQLGRTRSEFRLFQDTEAISHGTLWEGELKSAIAKSVFFVPIVTPTAVNSRYCKAEFELFLRRELELGREDLIFPILYIRVPALGNEDQRRKNDVLEIIHVRQFANWTDIRLDDVASPAVGRRIERFCQDIVEALQKPWLSPEERQRNEEADALKRADEERRRRLEAEAQRMEDERRRREEEAKRVAEVERGHKAAAEAEHLRLERDAAAEREAEERRKKEKKEEDERRRAEEERRHQEAEAKRKVEQERAFAAAKRADTVGAVDAFLATHPETHLAGDSRALRTALVAREDAFNGAMSSDDPAVLKAFLASYKKGPASDQVRGRLRRLEPQPSRRPLLMAGTVGVVLIGLVSLWLAVTNRAPVSPKPLPVQWSPDQLAATPVPPSPPPAAPEATPLRPPASPVQPVASRLSTEAERALKPKDAFKECTNCPEMVVVPAGSFSMGSPTSHLVGTLEMFDESPQHRVTVAKPFAVGRFAVTFDEWDACVADFGCNGYKPADHGWGRGRRPVIDVSWTDASNYLAWLSRKTGGPYRLLSEAEFEYTARAGSTTAYSWGDEIGKNNANCNRCGSQWGDKQTVPVGSFAANAFGLYDMAGNVWEWVEDCFNYRYNGAPIDGSAWTAGDCSRHVYRAGSWGSSPENLRSASRIGNTSTYRSSTVGFRVGRTLRP